MSPELFHGELLLNGVGANGSIAAGFRFPWYVTTLTRKHHGGRVLSCLVFYAGVIL